MRFVVVVLVAVLAAASASSAPAQDLPEFEVRAVATVPDTDDGRAPRLNALVAFGDDLLVVEERDGRLHRLTGDGGSEVWFDVAAAVLAATGRPIDTTNVAHGGLRGVAFHPDVADNGLLYTTLMETRPADPSAHTYVSDVAEPIGADGVLVEWRIDPATGRPDPGSYREVFRVGMPVYDHPIKQLAFDPFARPGDPDRGLLYVAHGDGSVFSAIAGGGRNPDALGKILRIDPSATAGASYSVPADNPFVGDPAMPDEVWSLGHRNPHHLAFALGPDGESVLIVAEPGRDNVEEINVIAPGADFGWPEREGTFVHLEGGGLGTGVAPLPADEKTLGFTYPAAQYLHTGPVGSTVTGEAVAGGFVVANGSALDGWYVAADFVTSGEVFGVRLASLLDAVTRLDPTDPDRDEPNELAPATLLTLPVGVDHDADPATPSLPRSGLGDVFDDAPTHETSRADVRFGQGPDGELYVLSKRNNTVYVVVGSLPPEAEPEPEPTVPARFDCATPPPGGGCAVGSVPANDWRSERS